MSNFFKHILPWQVIVAIIYLIFLVVAVYKNGDIYKFISAGVPVIFLISKIYYDKSKYVFIFYRKMYARLKNPGVNWKCSYVYTLNDYLDEDSFKTVSKNFVNSLREKEYEVTNTDFLKENTSSFKINDRDMKITNDYSRKEILVEFSSEFPYRDSISVFKDKFLIYKQLLETFTANTGESLYTLHFKFDKFNPFYSLYIHNYADIKVESFELSYSLKKLKISVSNKEMTITSNDEKSIKEAIENYLIISE